MPPGFLRRCLPGRYLSKVFKDFPMMEKTAKQDATALRDEFTTKKKSTAHS